MKGCAAVPVIENRSDQRGPIGRYWLIGLDEQTRGMRLPVDAPIIVGRGGYNHLVLEDSHLSRQHARVAPEDDGCVVYDLDSVNGTFVNGIAVRRHVLSANDVVSFGPYIFRVECDPDGAPAELEEPTLNGLDQASQRGRPHEETPVQARLRSDLALAAQIQKSFLPREVIAVEGIDLFAEYRAAYSVGGDFYDVFWVGPERLGVLIGDISGKGIAGALLMARISSELRGAALAHVDPVAVLTAMNEAIIARDQPELFFTAIYFTLDVTTGELLLANAGHPTPYWRHASGRVEPITAGRGCAVGILDDLEVTGVRLHLQLGDSLILYTDGVVEAASAEGLLYGQDRLEACLATAGARPNVIAESILRSVNDHAAAGPLNDDLTLFICQRSLDHARTMQPRRRSSAFPAPLVGGGEASICMGSRLLGIDQRDAERLFACDLRDRTP